MLRRLSLASLVVLILVATVLPGALVSAQDAAIESVCLVTDVGRVNDNGFNEFAYDGMNLAAEDFDLDTTFIETQAQADYPAHIATCLQEGYDVIVTVGFAVNEATAAAAAENPDVYFIGVDQANPDPENLPNYVGIQFREDQAGFLVGALAALMSETGTIAGVYGIEIPPVIKFRRGFEQGAAYINPEIEVLGVYIDNFVAPDRGAAAAEQFIGEGADVIFGAGGPTGSGAILYAASEGVMAIGVDKDEYFSTFGGESDDPSPGIEYLISSAVKRVDQGVYDMIAAVAEGEGFPESQVYALDVANEGIVVAPPHESDVPEEVTEQVQAILEGLADGSIETGVDPSSGALLGEETAAASFMVDDVSHDADLTTALTGAAEVPGPGDEDGSGTAWIAVEEADSMVCWQIQVADITLPAAAAHIHVGGADVAGDVVVPLSPPGAEGTSTGCGEADAAILSDILANPAGYYVNVHTSDFPSGAVRGQLPGM